MPVPLSEMGSLSIMSPQIIQNIPRFSNLPPPPQDYQDFTIIEDIFDIFAMPPYNSNPIIPAFPRLPIPSSPQPPLQGVPQDIYLRYPHPPVQTIVNGFNQQHPITSEYTQYPPFAGAVPYLENARNMDKTVAVNSSFDSFEPFEPLREGYASRGNAQLEKLRTKNIILMIIIFCLVALLLFLWWKSKTPAPAFKFYY